MVKIFPSDSTKWYEDNGDNTHRINYPLLNKNSVVVDVGARHGSWADQIKNKYFPQIFCFEVVPEFCEELKNKGYSVFRNAVYDKDGIIKIGIEEGEGSVYHENDTFEVESIEAKRIFEIIEKNNIDLIKINVEGAEYSILDNLIESKNIKNIKNLQIQFHIIETYEKEYDRISKELEKTHRVTWRYPFVWENWEII
jgi:hypothetical protein